MNEVAPRWDPKAPWALPLQTRRRALLVVCGLGLAVSYLLTWDLWLPRLQPPNLPAVDGFRSVGYGVPLLLAALAAPAFPRVGATLHTGLFVLAVLGDQVRLQPEFVSLAILLLGAAWPTTGLSITRWHLVALWGWAGFHKVLSGGWPTGGASFIATALGAPGVRTLIAVVVPVLEVGLALLAVKPRTWKVLRWAAPAFHLGVLVPLVVTEWNTAVWPWNLCLAAAAPLLFSKSVEDRTEGCTLTPRARISVAAVAAFLVVHPTGFYFGVTDAYLAHNLYSSNTAEASICSSASPVGFCRPSPFSTWEELNVPLPPEERLYSAWFFRICQPDQTLRVHGVWTRLSQREVTNEPCRRSVGTDGYRRSFPASPYRPPPAVARS